MDITVGSCYQSNYEPFEEVVVASVSVGGVAYRPVDAMPGFERRDSIEGFKFSFEPSRQSS